MKLGTIPVRFIASAYEWLHSSTVAGQDSSARVLIGFPCVEHEDAAFGTLGKTQSPTELSVQTLDVSHQLL